MTVYKVTAYIATIGYTRAIDRIYFIKATSEKHAENKVRYICKKHGKTAIIRKVIAA
jgi:hypothetical protein